MNSLSVSLWIREFTLIPLSLLWVRRLYREFTMNKLWVHFLFCLFIVNYLFFRIHDESIILLQNRDKFTFCFVNSIFSHNLLSEFTICDYWFIINQLALSYIQYLFFGTLLILLAVKIRFSVIHFTNSYWIPYMFCEFTSKSPF